jgi:5'-3' exonuclease
MDFNSQQHMLFIDGSYFCFHRFYSLINYWKLSNQDELSEFPLENAAFLNKFNETFIKTIKELPKKIGINVPFDKISIYVGKDCPREHIWRMELFKNYKKNRDLKKDKYNISSIFKHVYDSELFQKAGVKMILSHPRLEADDCIAIKIKNRNLSVLNKYYIITSDMDYLQLNYPNVEIFNLSYKKITESKNVIGNPSQDLMMKILTGDISDNIPSSFPKCGPKTALKCLQDQEFLNKKLNQNPQYIQQFELNKTLIDFNNIPDVYVIELNEKYPQI